MHDREMLCMDYQIYFSVSLRIWFVSKSV